MAFFGLPERDLKSDQHENIAVYDWNDESYDGLGDALQEGGDDLNDETFGSTDPIGKDFDFSNPVLPNPLHDQIQPRQRDQRQEPPRREERVEPEQPRTVQTAARPAATNSLESIWQDHSLFSTLPRANGSTRIADHPRASPGPAQAHSSRFSPFGNDAPVAIGGVIGQNQQAHQRVRTLQEIEAEMLANAQAEREREREREQEYLLQQEQERILQERFLQQQQQQLLQQQLLQQQQRLREDEARQRQLYQQEQQQAQAQRLFLQQREQLQQQRTPPPRMMPSSQSPRFLEHHRQILLLQQQEQMLQQQRAQELEEQLRLEEVERRLLAMNMERARGSPYNRRAPGFQGVDPQEVLAAQLLQQAQERQLLFQQQHQQQQQQQQQQQYRRQASRSRSPAVINNNAQFPISLQEESRYQPQNIQLQQRLLSDLAQADFGRDMHGVSPADQEALRVEAMRKILEAEKMEEKRRRKAAKIAHMSRYNDLMTQSDKDFITRIQVSQLVTQDPYADDFYAQVYGAIMRSRMGLQSQDERVLKFGSGGGIGLGLSSKGGNRRPSAMQRMEQQVERIVSNARKREEEKGLYAVHSLQGALGKTSGRSYKAAPRQLLQVDAGAGASPTLSHATANLHISKSTVHNEGAAKEAAKLGREALGLAAEAQTDDLVKKEPLTHRKVLVILEELYDVVLRVEQLRRDQPSPEDVEASQEWKKEYDELVDKLWDELRVMVPLQTSDPHPFISLLTPTKGKKILPRLTRLLDNQRMLTLLTLLVACFNQLDVVRNAPILDTINDTQERSDVERQTQAFLGSVMQSILPVISVANLRLVTGLLGLLLTRSNIVTVARTRPGLALLTLFLSRVEVIKQTIATSDLADVAEAPTIEESQQWRLMFDHLFQLLAPHLLSLFPSSRIVNPDPANHPVPTDTVDQPVWQFLAALALHGFNEQHHVLVGTLREKILDNVLSVNKGWVHDEEQRQTKLANVNLFLHAVNLDSSQIAM
ncbi:DNA topoisomerase 2-associated protein pat1 [Psilocybe cubensis]|uniref:DNA topoisomerase 2-associated protein pat1 n=1 Tax=Psilocybe cubensis TaxID=181762 RepID=A0ACB8GV14_PSICU|nr:DNA topoisomerase 2-associated protein pat1 [Psilocybe cubensis]KAH9479583.1 DNA topoisomerase 2-associated protein pat1 [Psilocybe cubensis]